MDCLPNLICVFILWRSGLGLLTGKFRQFLTELSACDMIMTGYYRYTFLFRMRLNEVDVKENKKEAT